MSFAVGNMDGWLDGSTAGLCTFIQNYKFLLEFKIIENQKLWKTLRILNSKSKELKI